MNRINWDWAGGSVVDDRRVAKDRKVNAERNAMIRKIGAIVAAEGPKIGLHHIGSAYGITGPRVHQILYGRRR